MPFLQQPPGIVSMMQTLVFDIDCKQRRLQKANIAPITVFDAPRLCTVTLCISLHLVGDKSHFPFLWDQLSSLHFTWEILLPTFSAIIFQCRNLRTASFIIDVSDETVVEDHGYPRTHITFTNLSSLTITTRGWPNSDEATLGDRMKVSLIPVRL